jgi:hypothetical protein
MALGIPITPHGDCEYCDGGSGYAQMAGAAARLRSGARPTAPPPTTIGSDGNVFLRVVIPPAAAGCGSCGTH